MVKLLHLLKKIEFRIINQGVNLLGILVLSTFEDYETDSFYSYRISTEKVKKTMTVRIAPKKT